MGEGAWDATDVDGTAEKLRELLGRAPLAKTRVPSARCLGGGEERISEGDDLDDDLLERAGQPVAVGTELPAIGGVGGVAVRADGSNDCRQRFDRVDSPAASSNLT
jgi:hypothetical protein